MVKWVKNRLLISERWGNEGEIEVLKAEEFEPPEKASDSDVGEVVSEQVESARADAECPQSEDDRQVWHKWAEWMQHQL